jgi:hypothetical protein
MKRSTEKILRIASGALLLILALNAFGGGFYGMSGAKDVPLEWLEGSPFHSYFIPGLILFVVIGGFSLITSIMVFTNHRFCLQASLLTTLIVFTWLLTQIFIIGYISWMQPTTAIVTFVILLLTALLPKKIA